MKRLALVTILFGCPNQVEPIDGGTRDTGSSDGGEDDAGECVRERGDFCERPGWCGARIACDGTCTGGEAEPDCECDEVSCGSDGRWTACLDPDSLGQTCTTTTACGGVIGCDGSCSGGEVCDDAPGPCQPTPRCDPISAACVYDFADLGTPCDDAELCTFADACDGAGTCAGTAIACDDDACATRACNGTDRCDEARLGTEIFETFDAGWDYSTAPGGTLAYRAPIQDLTTYLLAAIGILDRLQSLTTDEASTCDWCACAAPCAFEYTGRTIAISANGGPGMVPLFRWVNGNPLSHRSAVASPGAGWNQEGQLGFVCAP